MKVKSVLSIAGHDPSGGAGVSMDLRVIGQHGLAGLSVITAETLQTTAGVTGLQPAVPEMVYDQLSALLEDCAPAAVKIGIVPTLDIADAIARALRDYTHVPVVWDPVLRSSSGHDLFEDGSLRAIVRKLLSLCTLVTPNLHEAELLSLADIDGRDDLPRVAYLILALGANAVLIKGGHLDGKPDDYLRTPSAETWFPGVRIATANNHGTGCLLSSAIASNLALGHGLEQSVRAAKAFIDAALRKPGIVPGRGRGYPDVRNSSIDHAAAAHQARLAKMRGIYLVTDNTISGGRSHVEITRDALRGGVRVVQLRDKSASSRQLFQDAVAIRKLCDEYDALLIVNDRADIAVACGADGVHVGSNDLSPQECRRICGNDMLVGVSTGTIDEAREAAPWASYFGVGSIFATATKADAGVPVGLQAITQIRREFPQIPVVAIGGINASHLAGIAAAGAISAAVVSAIVSQPDIQRAADLCKMWIISPGS
jgi:hydroxymethylpyrimidine kinase/phosphomethylpyrimidine kinase/thiamine-phosphate diphosphorylase